MHEPPFDAGELAPEAPPEWFVPCPPMFVESGDGWALTAAAQAFLDPPAPSVADRIASVRRQLRELALDLPAAARAMAPPDLLDAVEALQKQPTCSGPATRRSSPRSTGRVCTRWRARPPPPTCWPTTSGSGRPRRRGG